MGLFDILKKKDGVITGSYFNGNKKYEKTYKDRKLNGVSKKWYLNGSKRWERHYKDGKLHGLETMWWDNGNILFQYHYENGVSEGEYSYYDRNGLTQEIGNKKNGKLDGSVIRWSKSRSRSEEPYKEGKLHGQCWYFNEFEVLLTKKSYINGKKVSHKEWWNYFDEKHKNKSEEKEVKKKRKSKDYRHLKTFHYETGSKRSEGYFPDGEWIGWYENGGIRCTGMVKNFKKCGVWDLYRNGKVYKSINFDLVNINDSDKTKSENEQFKNVNSDFEDMKSWDEIDSFLNEDDKYG